MNYIKMILFGFLGGTIASFLFLSFPEREPMETTPAPEPVISVPDFWQKIAAEQALSTVAIQSFKTGKVLREGSGVVVASDGVIVTTFDVVSGSDLLQVFYGDKIMRAQVVRYDAFKNLALVKVNSTNMDVSRLEQNHQFQPGQDIVVSGRLIELSNSTAFAQKGMISYILSKDIVLDTEHNYFLSGSKAINSSGAVVGMVYLRSDGARLIKAQIIDDFIKNYFESI